METMRGMKSRLGPFGHMPFTVYWAGGLISNIGTWLQAVVGSVFVYDRTGSALAVGILNFATFLPILIFSVWGGQISDRFDRRLITVVTHAISLVGGTALAVLTFMGNVTEVHVIATAFLLQTSWAIAKPSVISILPVLVPRAQLTEAVGLNTLQFMLAQLVGPVLATVLLGTAGYALAFSINAATFLGPILSMVYLYSRGLGGRAQQPVRAAASESPVGILAYMRSQPWIASVLLGVVATSAVIEIIRTTSPVLVSTRLGLPSSDTGLIVAAQSVGMVVGILASVPLGRRGLARTMAPVGFVFQLVGLLVVSGATQMAVAAPAVAPHRMRLLLLLPGAHEHAADGGARRGARPAHVDPSDGTSRQSALHRARGGRDRGVLRRAGDVPFAGDDPRADRPVGRARGVAWPRPQGRSPARCRGDARLADPDVHGLHAREREDLLEAVLQADARVAPAAERYGREPRLDVVDPEVARLHAFRQTQRLVEVLRPDRGGEPVAPGVRERGRLVLGPPGHRAEHRPEDLFDSELRACGDAVDDGGGEERSVRSAGSPGTRFPVSTRAPATTARWTAPRQRSRAATEIIAPISVAGSIGRPTLIFAARAATRASTSSAMDSWITRRLVEPQL